MSLHGADSGPGWSGFTGRPNIIYAEILGHVALCNEASGNREGPVVSKESERARERELCPVRTGTYSCVRRRTILGSGWWAVDWWAWRFVCMWIGIRDMPVHAVYIALEVARSIDSDVCRERAAKAAGVVRRDVMSF